MRRLNDKIAVLDRYIAPLADEFAANLLAFAGVGIETANAKSVAMAETDGRPRSGASFVVACGIRMNLHRAQL